MGIKQRLEADTKTALLAGDKEKVNILRTLKGALLDAEISQGKRQEGLSEPELINLFSKESKKRQDAAELYKNAGEAKRAAKELAEQQIIAEYLPEQLSEAELSVLVDGAFTAFEGELTQQNMGKLISLVREKADGQVDGSRIAAAVKARLVKT